MALLLNRKYGSRLECLYYILKSCLAKFGTAKAFGLNDLKYDCSDPYNVHKYCDLLIDCIGFKCCPFLVNPLNLSKCYATQSIDSDSTKSKAASDIAGSLEALGFITKVTNRSYKISQRGELWASSPVNSQDWSDLALAGVLSYGPVIGFLSKIREKPDEFSYSGIYLGYPKTEETVPYTDASGATVYVSLSNDSRSDSNIRTLSRVICWCVAVGLLEPKNAPFDNTSDLPHIKYREFLKSSELTVRKYRKTDLCRAIFDTRRFVENPLSYERLHKNVGSLRERGGDSLRLATMRYRNNILNRRFVFVYILNHCSKQGKLLNFDELVSIMTSGAFFDKFFTPGNNGFDIMSTEAEIADVAGIPFDVVDGNLKALTVLNTSVLHEKAPREAISLAKQILDLMR